MPASVLTWSAASIHACQPADFVGRTLLAGLKGFSLARSMCLGTGITVGIGLIYDASS
jgi:hypothetical protein